MHWVISRGISAVKSETPHGFGGDLIGFSDVGK
jgi:hypothetical protein